MALGLKDGMSTLPGHTRQQREIGLPAYRATDLVKLTCFPISVHPTVQRLTATRQIVSATALGVAYIQSRDGGGAARTPQAHVCLPFSPTRPSHASRPFRNPL